LADLVFPGTNLFKRSSAIAIAVAFCLAVFFMEKTAIFTAIAGKYILLDEKNTQNQQTCRSVS
jgi:hypothetical protein